MRIIIECKGKRREFRLPEGISVVGRDPGCDICYPEGSLSRRHLELELSGQQLTVRDLETKNGTFIGQQRIHEARLQPGMRLRAGNVWMRFDQDEPSDTRPLEVGSAELERRVPDAPDFQADDAPTPADESLAQSAAGGEGAGTEMIVRDGRWYVRDTTTGAEVEVVPSAAPAGDAAPVVLPAVVTRREESGRAAPVEGAPLGASPRSRKLKILLIGALLMAVLLGALALFLPAKKGPQSLSLTAYREMMAGAVKEYQEGRTENAAQQLERLSKMPMQTRTELPSLLLVAFKADAEARRAFEEKFEEAKKRWADVQRSAESGGVPSAKLLAEARLLWIRDETESMASLTEAKQAMERRDFLKALTYARQVRENSAFYKDVPAILEESITQLKKVAADQAAAQNWSDAIASMKQLAGASPALAGELEPKIAQYRRYEEQRKKVEAARAETDAGAPGRAVDALTDIPPDSPYAKEAAGLLAVAHAKDLIKQADAAYNAGDGPKALEILATLPKADPEKVQRIKQVVAAHDAALAALKDLEFGTAQDKFNEVLRYEKPESNHYAAEAKANLAALSAKKGAAATQLVDAGDKALLQNDYLTARRKYQQAIFLDPTNRNAPARIKKMEDDAIVDYNRALNMVKDDPQTALQILLTVADRLPNDHPYSHKVQVDIFNLQLRLGKKPTAPPEDKQP